MAFGISVYPGLDNTIEENISFIKCAAKCGVSKLFTSLHIPECDPGIFADNLRTLLAAACDAQFHIIADITPESAAMLGVPADNPEVYHKIGIDTLRLDDGFDAEKTAAFTHRNANIRLQLNASTVSEKFLSDLLHYDADFTRIEALHNFYPHTGTGLSLQAFKEKTALLQHYGIRTGAFVASKDGKKRSPLFDGLPTLEMHRELSVDLAARHLSALGVDDIYLSDSLPTEHELTALTQTSLHCVSLRALPAIETDDIFHFLSEPFTARTDDARDTVRALESRKRAEKYGKLLIPQNTVSRPFGTVTIDNSQYLRYTGELQIIKRHLPADPRTNVIAYIRENEKFLIPCIRPGNHFRILLDR